MPNNSMVLSLLSQYELLEWIARHLSTIDLFYLSLTCSEVYQIVRQSETVFQRLKRLSLCDGRGLKARQEFKGLQRPYYFYDEGKGYRANYDEEIEVRVWNLKCDATNALPCSKCGINVCEECRYVPRVRDNPCDYSRRRPHLDGAFQCRAITCYCTSCDEDVERHLPLRLSEYCDCDQYTRWICQCCKLKEDALEKHYFKMRTEVDMEIEDPGAGMVLDDNQSERAFWCPCGQRSPKDGNIRCSWCKRRHNLATWQAENRRSIPFFDNDPCFPRIEPIPNSILNIMYPRLAYTGPIAP